MSTGDVSGTARFSFHGAANDQVASELLAFSQWLRNEELLRGQYEMMRSPVAPGKMGGAINHLLVQVTDPTVIGALLIAYWRWLQARRATIKATIEDASGQSLNIDLAGLTRKQVDEMLPAIIELIQRPPPEE